MTDEKQKKDLANVGCQNTQQEDAAMKTLALFFAEELFPLLNIKGKVRRVAPTEMVHLELKKMYQDFNYEMEDNSWVHLEFQSTNEGVQGLKRFRTYEALTSYQYGVAITTYVLFSGNIKTPVTEYSEGINTYRIHPIILQGRNADQLLERLEAKIQTGEEIKREELVEPAMCSLMGGESSQKERFHRSFAVMREIRGYLPIDKEKIEAVMYAMAEKFLDEMDLEEMKEDLKMWKIGKILMNEGRSEGWNEGRNEGAIEATQKIIRNMKDKFSVEQIAEATDMSIKEIEDILQSKA